MRTSHPDFNIINKTRLYLNIPKGVRHLQISTDYTILLVKSYRFWYNICAST
jgi:hypothetical protein